MSAPRCAVGGEEAASPSAEEKGEPVRVVAVPWSGTAMGSVRASSWDSEGDSSAPNASRMERCSASRVSRWQDRERAIASLSAAISEARGDVPGRMVSPCRLAVEVQELGGEGFALGGPPDFFGADGFKNGKHLIFRLNFPPNFRLNCLRVLGLGYRV